LVVETGWCESYPKLLRDVDIWMNGTGLETRVAILVNFTKRGGARVAGFVEVFRAVGNAYTMDPRRVKASMVWTTVVTNAEITRLYTPYQTRLRHN
jgi:hypothetical protein